MSTELALSPVPEIVVSPEQIDVVKRTVFPGATNDELALYIHDCVRQNVHPLDRLIHPQIRTDKKGVRRYVAITSIDLMRSRADDTGVYAGNDDPAFQGQARMADFQASVTVYKLVAGQRCPFIATARWTEYKPADGFMWDKMPHLMLGKVAEALALRKAFPRQLHGLYAREEMDQSADSQPAQIASPSKAVEPPKPREMSQAFKDFMAGVKAIIDRDGHESTSDERKAIVERVCFARGMKLDDLWTCDNDQFAALLVSVEDLLVPEGATV